MIAEKGNCLSIGIGDEEDEKVGSIYGSFAGSAQLLTDQIRILFTAHKNSKHFIGGQKSTRK
jgi:hypothetical protein